MKLIGPKQIKARREPAFQQTIDNWSPTLDFVTTSSCQDHDPDENTAFRDKKQAFPTPDQIYACAGKGEKGEIVEFRYGVEAHIGLEMEFHSPIMNAWVLPAHTASSGLEADSLFLLSLGNSSAVLQLSDDAGSIHEVAETATPFDLRYRTITAAFHDSYRIQVTEYSVVLIHGSQAYVIKDFLPFS